MTKFIAFLQKWGPAVLMMAVIFTLSSIPSKEMPSFSWADTIVKKGGHMLGYGLLALGYARGLGSGRKRWLLAWLLAVAYAITDEFHQSFVLGRNPSLLDVIIDGAGGGTALWIWSKYLTTDRHR